MAAVERIEGLLEEVEGLRDAAARDTATAAVQALLDLYGEGLGRLVEIVAERDVDGSLAEAVAADELVAHLLLLHGLHPVPLEARVRGALDEVRPYLASHGGGVELLGVEEGVARLRLEGSCNGCPSSTMTLKLAIEDAIHKAAPDLVEIEAVGAAPDGLIPLEMMGAPPPPSPGLIPLEMMGAPPPPSPGLIPLEVVAPSPPTAWSPAGALPELDGVREVRGESVLFLHLDDDVLAYRPGCPACGASLGDAALSGAELACPGCGHRFDVRRAGRSVDAPDLHLAPVPLLVDDAGAVKVALG
jgi:Fe-S cluster biogenesis protein NfuA/nitrite reductase/ring-hydroxylating ferredoxin subunit